MLSTVGSNFLREVDYKKILEAQENQKRQTEEMSGSTMKKLSDYSYLDRKLKLNIESSISVNTLYIEHNERQMLEFDVMIKSVENVRDSALSFIDALKSFKNSDDDGMDQYRISEIILKDVINALNAEFNGKYLFSGDEVLKKPVDEDFKNFDLGNGFNLESEDILKSNHYLGGTDVITIRTTKNTTMSYDITANNEHVAVLLNLLNAFVNHKIDNEYYMDKTIAIVEEVTRGMDAIVAEIKSMNSGLLGYKNTLEQENAVLKEVIDENNNFNMMKVYTELVSKNKDLETSLEMNSKIDKSRWRTDR